MSTRARAVVLGLCAIVCACGASREPLRVARHETVAPDAGVALDAAGPAAPAIGPELTAFLDERDALSAPSALFATRAQSAPKGFKPIPPKRAGAFPGVPFAEVRAFNMGFGGYAGSAGCELVAKDGTMCPSVTAPGTVVPKDEAARLLALVRDAKYWVEAGPGHKVGRAHTRCDFDPHHAFVFFDAGGAPVAQVEVCFTCGEWDALPHVDGIGDGPAMMRDDERAELVRLCASLHLGACVLADRAKMETIEQATFAAHEAPADGTSPLLARALSRAPAIDPRRALADTTVEERRALCAWWSSVWGAIPHPGTETYGCTSGRAFDVFDWAGCVASFPSCGTVGAGLACQRAIASDLCVARPATDQACTPRCTWGLRERATK